MESHLRIDLDAVLRAKAPAVYRKLPRFVIRILEAIICQKQLNLFLEQRGDLSGVAFARALIDDHTAGVKVYGLEKLESGGRYLFASNHPLGGMDGIALLAVLGEKYSGRVWFVVNDVLMYVTPLRSIFLPINKFGLQNREIAESLNREFHSDRQILYFPSGQVSRRQPSGEIEDGKWHKSFVVKAKETCRDVVPIYFKASNSKFFYRFSYWRMRLGIKMNLDVLFLPRELFNKKKKSFEIYIGDPISVSTFDESRTPSEWAEWVRKRAYAMSPSSSVE